MATSLPWYKEVSPTQKSVICGLVRLCFDGFDYMLITYVLLDIQRNLP